jgi:hypothetical protein
LRPATAFNLDINRPIRRGIDRARRHTKRQPGATGIKLDAPHRRARAPRAAHKPI